MANDRVCVRFVIDEAEARSTMAKLYWEQDEEGVFVHRVDEIAQRFDVSGREVRELVKEACVAESERRACDGCGEAWRYSNRSEATAGRRSHTTCDRCREEQAREKQEAEESRARAARALIADQYRVPNLPLLRVQGLTLHQAVPLLALIRLAADERFCRIQPLGDVSDRLSPWPEYDYSTLNRLADETLCVDPESPTDAFVWDSGAPDRYYLDSVGWRVRGPEDALRQVAAELIDVFEARDFPDAWKHESKAFQTGLASAELISYLLEQLERHHIPFSPGEKTHEVATAMAERFSIGEGYNLIWRSVRDAAAFMVREGCPKRRAAGYSIAAMRRTAEKAEAGGWEIKPYGRSWGLPESEITHVFYRLFLGEENPMTTQPPRHESVASDF